jgi:hypothetical protein
MAMTNFSKFASPKSPKRLCFLYFPNGVGLPPKESEYYKKWNWFPIGEGTDYKLTKSLEPLSPYRNDMSIMGGLSHPFSRNVLGHMAGDSFLTGGDLRGEYKNSVSIDQVAAKKTKSIYAVSLSNFINRWRSRLQIKNLYLII